MRPSSAVFAPVLLLPLLLAAGAAHAEFGLFGSAGRTPANPFASNYASPPVRGAVERPRRPHRGTPDAPRPRRAIPR